MIKFKRNKVEPLKITMYAIVIDTKFFHYRFQWMQRFRWKDRRTPYERAQEVFDKIPQNEKDELLATLKQSRN